MGTLQEIVTISSSVPCHIDGYPTLRFGLTSQHLIVSAQHSGVDGHRASSMSVALGTGTPASFLVQSSMGVAAENAHCKSTPVLLFGVPGSTPSVPVSLSGVRRNQTAWSACRQVQVTPIEQGNTVDQYA